MRPRLRESLEVALTPHPARQDAGQDALIFFAEVVRDGEPDANGQRHGGGEEVRPHPAQLMLKDVEGGSLGCLLAGGGGYGLRGALRRDDWGRRDSRGSPGRATRCSGFWVEGECGHRQKSLTTHSPSDWRR